jgi:regulatory protein
MNATGLLSNRERHTGFMPRVPFPGVISSVEAQQSVRSHLGPRANVFIGGKFSFALSLEVVGKHGLRPDLEITPALLEQLLQEDGQSKALATALAFLGHRARSESEIRKRLERDEWSEPVVDAVLLKLRAAKLVNDEEFAQQWVDNRSRFKPRGGRLLQQELRQKGVARDDIEAALPDADEETDNALLALRKTARKWEAFPDERERQKKALDFLARRGFSFSASREAWRRLGEEAEEED